MTPNPLDVPVLALNVYDDNDQALKDQVHERITSRCEPDEATGCWIYTGSWDSRGHSKVRVGQRPYSLSRVVAWLYIEGFELWSDEWVYHTCPNQTCANHEHLAVAATRAEALAAMRRLGLFGSVEGRGKSHRPGRRLNADKAAVIRERLAAGDPPAVLAKINGVRVQAITMIGDGRSWRPRVVDERSVQSSAGGDRKVLRRAG